MDVLNPAKPLVNPYGPSGYASFITTLVGISYDHKVFTQYDGKGYYVGFTWKSDTLVSAAGAASGKGVFDVSPVKAEPPAGRLSVVSGGVFDVQLTDQRVETSGITINPIPDVTGSPGQTIALTAMAQDPAEGQILAYSLAPGFPSGASIDPARGSFTWSIPANEPPGDYLITINVSDDASPPLTASTSFTIHVQAPATLQTTNFSAVSGSGSFGSTATLTATLTSGGSPLAGKAVSFALNVNGSVTPLGTATTDANGIATLPNANIAGANVGTTPGAISVNFAGDATYLGSSASGSLTVSPRDVSSQVGVTNSGLVYNRATQQFGGTMTLTNTGTTALDFSFEVVLTNLPAGVTLANASGYTADGNPYILVDLPGGVLAPGQSVSFTVLFRNPNRTPLQYGAMIFNE